MAKKTQKAICIFGSIYMLEQVMQLENQIADALHSDDIEAVHQLRVASRRLRNGFSHFGDCLPGKKSTVWQESIRQITKALGNARDLDIQIECVNQLYNDGLEEKYQPGYRRLLLRLRQRRAKAQAKVEQTLTRLQARNLLQQMRTHLEKLTLGAEDIYLFTPSLYQKAFMAVNDHLDDFLSYEAHIHDPENIEKLHAMRIAGKHLRYTMEIFAPIYDKALIPYVQVMKDLQDQLGLIHDADIWVSWLPKFIEKEKVRIEDYFGNIGPLKRLLPGFKYLIEDRQKFRMDEYQAFLSTWETLKAENAWMSLKEIIKIPINVEAALSHYTVEETFEPEADDLDENDDDEAEASEFEVELPPGMLDEPSSENDLPSSAEKPTQET